MSKLRGVRFSLVVWFVSIFGISLVALSFFLYRFFANAHQNDFDASLYNYSVDVSRSLETDFFGRISINSDLVSLDNKFFPFQIADALVQIRTIDGKPIAKTPQLRGRSLPFSDSDQEPVIKQRAVFRTLPNSDQFPGNKGRYRLINFLIDRGGPSEYVLQVAAPMVHWHHERGQLLALFFTLIPIVLLVSVVGGLLLSNHALRPVQAIVRTARKISARNLSERLPLPGSHDEIRELAETLNDLLHRLEMSFHGQEQFIADASHQLKTPIAVLNGELEFLTSAKRSEEEIRTGLTEAKKETDVLVNTVNNLLNLARADLGKEGLSKTLLRIDEVLLEVSSRLERLARKRSIQFKIDFFTEEGTNDTVSQNPFELSADSELIRCLFENLIENAIKYSPEGAGIDIELRDSKKSLTFRVKDWGPGISEEDRTAIFERFRRARSSSNPVPGTGLGLAIAKRIAELHNGQIGLESNAQAGATFFVTLPK